jgi:hypothetical protein
MVEKWSRINPVKLQEESLPSSSCRFSGGKTMPHRKYRELERDCHRQAAITGQKQAREVLEEMEREYRAIADWLESRQARASEHTPSRG